MKAIEKELLKQIDNVSGKVILVGISFDAFIKKIEKSKKIKTVDLLNSIKISDKDNKNNKDKSVDIPLKKMRKIYKNKNIDYIFIDYNHISKYLKDFVSHSIFINKKTIYIVFKSNIEASYVKRLYENYGCKTNLEKIGRSHLLTIDTNNVKTNKFKDSVLKISVKTEKILDLIEKYI